MILHQEDTLDLIKFWRKFIKDFIGLLVNKTCWISAEHAKSSRCSKEPDEKKNLRFKYNLECYNLEIYNVRAPFERIQMDVLGPLPITFLGNKYLLVVVDCFTKWLEVFPLKKHQNKDQRFSGIRLSQDTGFRWKSTRKEEISNLGFFGNYRNCSELRRREHPLCIPSQMINWNANIRQF